MENDGQEIYAIKGVESSQSEGAGYSLTIEPRFQCKWRKRLGKISKLIGCGKLTKKHLNWRRRKLLIRTRRGIGKPVFGGIHLDNPAARVQEVGAGPTQRVDVVIPLEIEIVA